MVWKVIIVLFFLAEIWWILSKSKFIKEQYAEKDIETINKFLLIQIFAMVLGVLLRGMFDSI